MRTFVVAVVLVGCSKGGDECERLVDKMTSAAPDLGDKVKDRDKAIAECRKNIDKVKNDPVVRCVIEADGASAVKDCMAKGLGDFKRKSKRTEAALQLNKIGKRAVVTDWTSDPVWTALEFQIDEPNLFHYSYESDGKTFKATAVGDLDCDGKPSTYTLDGKSENGNPSVTL